MAEPTSPAPLDGRKTRRAGEGAGGASRIGGRPAAGGGGFGFGSRSLSLLIGAVLLAVVLVAALTGLRDNDDDGARTVAAAGATSVPATAAAPAKAPTACKQPKGIPAAAGKPADISTPAKPVTALRVRDLRQGNGAVAADGAKLTVQYVGVSCASGRQFDSSWDRGQPFEFTLGGAEVIPGWDQGIKGMKVGGRRLLWIPASLGYREQGQPPEIAPSDTLIFVIDLEKVA